MSPEERAAHFKARLMGEFMGARIPDQEGADAEIADDIIGEIADAIRAAEAAAEKRGAEREREECAQLAEDFGESHGSQAIEAVQADMAENLAAAIRARGQEEKPGI